MYAIQTMYPIQTIPLNLNFRQNHAHIWKVCIMPRLFMTCSKKIFSTSKRAKTSCWVGYMYPIQTMYLLKGLIVAKPKIFAEISPFLAWFFNFALNISVFRSDNSKYNAMSPRILMAWRFQNGPNHCCSTMGSFENQWFYEKLIFSFFYGRNLLKNLTHAVRICPSIHTSSCRPDAPWSACFYNVLWAKFYIHWWW